MIDVSGLRKVYEDHLAVDGLSFSLAPGQVCGLVGPNGAGKTTTLRSLAGLLRPTAGQITVAGCDPEADEIELKRRVAYVPDDPPLFDDLSVQAHLELIGRLYRVKDYHQKAADLLERFDLLPKANAGTTTLSRGMRQKLAVCCVYLFNPQVLLLGRTANRTRPARHSRSTRFRPKLSGIGNNHYHQQSLAGDDRGCLYPPAGHASGSSTILWCRR